ncbi:putative ABC multidrug transporter [Talaromyces proteolyticus]|uniref:ABC multidrug transporter n=1 Tax=Talaromyces proteolyticus TaxID=1131652 RepID=A0AAD4KVC3_9EURO|nr:putative ABC multidrug transporter [Talaromyces proteolyticus]KAH8700278.1 putative ABC multidrug transporter [Talaromyces proteolyticus]
MAALPQAAATELHREEGAAAVVLDEKLAVQSSHSPSSASAETEQEAAPAKGNSPPRKWHSRFNPLRLQKIPPVPEERVVSREHGANFFSLISFQWMAPLMHTGYLRPLQHQDIWKVNPDRSVYVLKAKLNESFDRRLERGGKYPLLFALYDTFKVEFWIGGICQLFSSLFMVFSPYMTRYLIAYATEAYTAKEKHQPGPNIGDGVGYAVGITCMQILQSLGTNQFIYRGFMVGGQARAVLVNILFDKTMKISGRARAGGTVLENSQVEQEVKGPGKAVNAGDGRGWSNGRIITLMSVDADRINTAMGMFHLLWTAPIAIIVTLILLLVNIGYSALSGFALLVLGMPAVTVAVRALFKRRKAINKFTDQRVSLTQEILQSVRFVKFFGWESSFLERLKEIRKREILAIQILLAIRNAVLCISMSLPTFASMLSFITYSLSQHILTPAPIFSSLALFNSLRMPLNLLPQVLGQVTDAWTGLMRIQEFLLAEEIKDDIEWDDSMTDAISLEKASFTWERTPNNDKGKDSKTKGIERKRESPVISEKSDTEAEPFKIKDLNFSVKRNELLAVIGTVGSGKTSLLAALAGDMRLTDGSIRLGASRAYCPQYAWIQNATVKNNILFGKDYDERWYNTVVDACALRPDFDVFPSGDSTEIGERGITVSGGQKQRLNIARAIYFNADIVLMDDPLSAVDAHVGRHIMEHAICGLLKDKCRILATHQLHVLNRCDRIILMDNGRVAAVDTFDNLMRDSQLFQRLMSTTAQDRQHEEKDEDDKIEAERDTPAKKAKPGKQVALMQQEERATDSVGWGVWKAYILSTGSILNVIIVLVTILLTNGANIMTSLWLTYWTSDKYPFSTGEYIAGYAALAASQTIFVFIYSTVLTNAGTNASRTMLHRAMNRVLRAPMSFFDTTPLGRVTNRFSKDIHVMDNELCDAMRIYALTITMIISVIVLIIVYFHYFAIAFGPLLILFLIAANYYRASARDMKRFEAVLRSHVFSRFSEAISGVASIRAYGLQEHFGRSISDAIDEMDSAFFLTYSNQRWLSVRLDAVGYVMVLVTGILVVTSRFDVSPSISGLVLSYILAIVQMLQFTIRQLAEVENDMNATERVHYYGTQLEEEAPLHLGQVEPSWPEQGRVTFSNVHMRYRAGLPLVLRGLDMDISGGERIGIVGRTGAGKSSIMSALFRITELSEGSITIDGLDISKIGLHDLRSRLAIIPQDPTLFRGTVRSNLDPFNEHSDLKLWDALRKSHLIGEEPAGEKELEAAGGDTTENSGQSGSRIQLDSVVDEEGLNFSLGQRQLMALARALVRDSRIIVCDEATSSVDFETDRKIQRTMATGFKGKTLLCIAHRLRTIITYDRICVMDQGQIAEMDTPLNLWEKNGIFRSMCDRSGIEREDFFQTEA